MIYVTHRLNEVFRILTASPFCVIANVGVQHRESIEDAGRRHCRAEAPTPRRKRSSKRRPTRRHLLRWADFALAGVVNDLRGVDLSLMDEIRPMLADRQRPQFLRHLRAPSVKGRTSPRRRCSDMRGPPSHRKGVALVPEDRQRRDWCWTIRSSETSACPGCRISPGRVGFGLARRRRPRRRSTPVDQGAGPSTASAISLEAISRRWSSPNGTMRAHASCCDEPTVGVDVGRGKSMVLSGGGSGGAGILVASSDLSELILPCDRISVVVDGRHRHTQPREFGDAEPPSVHPDRSDRTAARRDQSGVGSPRRGARTQPRLAASPDAVAERMAVDALSGLRCPSRRL